MPADFGDTVFTQVKSNFMIITDHMAWQATVIGCLSGSSDGGHNVVLTRMLLPSLYTASIPSQEKRSNVFKEYYV